MNAKVLPPYRRPTENALRDALADGLARVQGSASDGDAADALGKFVLLHALGDTSLFQAKSDHSGILRQSLRQKNSRSGNSACHVTYRYGMFWEMSSTISQIVTAWRAGSGLSQAGAANHVGVSQPVFSRIESGTRFPDEHTARRFVAAGVFTPEQYGRAALLVDRAA